MALSSGTRLGPYTLQASVGSGGMGEVYRAVDTRLGRAVAIKVLPAHLADAVDALGRFEQETRAVAALNHPNILALHDVGRDGGVAYAVAELLEGETLRARSAGGPLTPRRAQEFAIQIAHGLSAAHERGSPGAGTHHDVVGVLPPPARRVRRCRVSLRSPSGNGSPEGSARSGGQHQPDGGHPAAWRRGAGVEGCVRGPRPVRARSRAGLASPAAS